jgi:transposase-like protein
MAATLGRFLFHKHLKISENSEELIGWLQQAGIIASGRQCSCGRKMSQHPRKERGDGVSWRCPYKLCKHRVSLRQGSYFEGHQLPLGQLWMILVCLLKFPKMLARYMSEILNVSERALVDWGAYMRETISHYYLVKPLVLGGGYVVQVDESLFGGRRKYNRGDHHVHVKSWVFGVVEEGTNRCVLWTVRRRNKETLSKLIKDHVVAGSTVKSDEWGAYKGLGDQGYNHLTVNHSVSFVNSKGVHTQLIESLWAQVKCVLKAKRGTSQNHLPGYLDMFSFQRDAESQSKTSLELFIELIQVDHCY